MGKDQKTEQKATVKMIDVEVRAGYLETRDGISKERRCDQYSRRWNATDPVDPPGTPER
jgi:hypothetical protein